MSGASSSSAQPAQRQLDFASLSIFKGLKDTDGQPLDVPVRLDAKYNLYATDLAFVMLGKDRKAAREVTTF
jgi:hypothetical protein